MANVEIHSGGSVFVLEAPVQVGMINFTFPAILRNIPPGSGPIFLLTSSSCAADLRPEFVGQETEVRSYENFNTNPRVELDLIHLCASHPDSSIVALREQDLMRAARVRRRFGLQGMKPEQVIFFRDKLLMKQRAEQAGLAVPRFMPVDTGEDVAKACETFAYPWILKPRRKAGGMGFRVLRDDVDIDRFLDEIAPQLDWDEPLDLIAEEFVGTRMFHVDGIWNASDFEYLSVAEYLGLKPHHQLDPAESRHILSGSIQVPVDDVLHDQLRSFTERLLNSLGNEALFAFHAEIWLRDGTLLLNEVACRTGGGQVYFLQNEVFGKNPDELHLSALQGRLTERKHPTCGNVTMVARVPPRRGTFTGIHAALPPGTRLDLLIDGPAELDNPKNWFDAVGFVYASARNQEEVQDKVRKAISAFDDSLS